MLPATESKLGVLQHSFPFTPLCAIKVPYWTKHLKLVNVFDEFGIEICIKTEVFKFII